MNPIQDFLFDPDPSIGGGIIPLLGMPGSGKTVALTQLALKGIKNDNYVLWRGTKQAQWKHLLANDVPVVLWNHETISDIEGYITSETVKDEIETIDLEDKNVEIRSWSQPEDVIEHMQMGKANVVNIPGLAGSRSDRYFFMKTWIDFITALSHRRSGRMIVFPFDEIGDVVPSQQQLKKPFYSLVAERLPPQLAQLRKKRVLLYGAAHSTHDVHYMLWKIKSNSILYMSNSVVKRSVTPSIDQEEVTGLDRGEFVFAGSQGSFGLPRMPESLSWVPEKPERLFNVDWTADIPDLLSDDDDEDDSQGTSGRGRPSKLGKIGLAIAKFTDMKQKDVASILEIDPAAISKAKQRLDD